MPRQLLVQVETFGCFIRFYGYPIRVFSSGNRQSQPQIQGLGAAGLVSIARLIPSDSVRE